MPHRFLFGPVAAPLPADRLAEAGRAGGCRPFGPGGLDLAAADTWADVTSRLPSGWVPDFVVLNLPGGCIPGGLWSAPVPLVALVGDWELRERANSELKGEVVLSCNLKTVGTPHSTGVTR
jgi:hypothetical protein